MKRYIPIYLLLSLVVATNLLSCNKKDEPNSSTITDYSVYSGATTLVSSFKLQANTKILSNLDSVHFTIDQDRGIIYNADSLPRGTRVNALLVDLTCATNVSTREFIIKNGTRQQDTIITYTSSSKDSIDFTGDVTLRITSYDNQHTRDYKVKVNVHKQVPDSIVWNTAMRRDLPGAESTLFESKTVMKNDVFVCLVDNNSYYVLSESTDPLGPWDSKPVTFPFEPQVNSLTATSDALYMLDENGQLFKSTDMGDSWSDCGVAWHSLIGAYGNKVLGVKNDGGTWMHDQYPQGDDFVPTPLPQRFPVSGMSQLVMASNEWTSSQQAMMMGGLLANGSCSNAVWGYDGETWGLINDAPGTQALPALHDALMFPYYTYVVAPNGYTPSKQVTWIVMGGKHPSGDINTVSYVSRNQCINWSKGENGVQLPAHVPAFSGAQAFTFSRVQPRLLSYNPGQTTPISEWDCPYIYIMGGNAASGAALNSIWEGVLTRLTYKPVF